MGINRLHRVHLYRHRAWVTRGRGVQRGRMEYRCMASGWREAGQRVLQCSLPSTGGMHCFLFGHSTVVPVKSLGGECYRIIKGAEDNKEIEPEKPKSKPKPAEKSAPPPKQEDK